MKKNIQTIVLVIAMFAVFSLGCGMLKPNAVTEKSDPKETYVNALKKLKEIKSAHLKQKSVFKNSTIHQIIEEDIYYQAPDRTKTITKVNTIADPNGSTGEKITESISIGKDIYTANDSPKSGHTKGVLNFPAAIDETFSAVLSLMFKRVKDGAVKEIKFVGKENVQGKEVLTYTDEFGGTLSVSAETGLPVSVSGKNLDKTTSISFDYEKDHKIEIPNNIK